MGVNRVVGLGDTIGIEEEAVSWLELELALPVFQEIEPGKEQSMRFFTGSHDVPLRSRTG